MNGWQTGASEVETGQIPNAGRGIPLITRLNGYSAPQVVFVQSGSYFRRREATGRAGGASVSAPLGEWIVTGFGEVGAVSEGQFSLRVADPPTDTWEAASFLTGVAAQRLVGGTLFTTGARGAGLRGEALLTGADSVIYRGNERHVNLHVDARRQPANGQPWGYQLRLDIDYEDRDRGDTLQYAVRVQLESLDVAFTTGLARRISGALSLAVELSHGRYSPRGSIPPRDLYPLAARPARSGNRVPRLAAGAQPRRAGSGSRGARRRTPAHRGVPRARRPGEYPDLPRRCARRRPQFLGRFTRRPLPLTHASSCTLAVVSGRVSTVGIATFSSAGTRCVRSASRQRQ